MKKFFAVSLIALVSIGFTSCETEESLEVKIDFQGLSLNPESFWNGSDGSGNKKIGIATFTNTFNDWGGGYTSWTGFSFSNLSNITTPGLENQYSAMVSEGQVASNIYAVAYCVGSSTYISFDWLVEPLDLDVTNSTYTYLAMLNGDEYSKKFGGESGMDPDWLLLTIEGYNGAVKTNSVEFYLADFRFSIASQDYLVSKWTNVDLSPLGRVDKIVFKLTSSDIGDWGMNTPAYLALDNLKFKQI
jgi:hypothetical protein